MPKLFVSCGRGLEKLLENELLELGFKQVEALSFGVEVLEASLEDTYKINYLSRIATRVLLVLDKFYCDGAEALYKRATQFDWCSWFSKGQSLAIDANVSQSSIRNSLFAAQKLKDAICDSLRAQKIDRPNIDLKNAETQLNLHIHQDKATIYWDSSGAPLYKRGYRIGTGAAPISETLAAAILRLASYSGNEILFDPCNGSGTFLIEAAMIASKTPAGFFREKWAFMNHPDFDGNKWQKIKDEADKQKKSLPEGLFWGVEKDPEVFEAALANFASAGFKKNISLFCEDFRKHKSKAAYSLLITNPPHGKRLGDEMRLKTLYLALGDFMKKQMVKPAKAFVFTSSNVLSKSIGLSSKRRHVLYSGKDECRLVEFDLY